MTTDRYETLVEQEDEKAQRLATTEYVLLTVMDNLFLRQDLNRTALRESLIALLKLKHAQEMELTLIRLSKAFEATKTTNRL